MAYANGPEVLVAHRGIAGSSQADLNIPEQSIPAWIWAIEHGADVVELDFQVTRDDQIVAMHDATINRTTNRTGYVRDRSLAYITAAWLELPEDKDGNGNPDNTKFHPPSAGAALASLKGYPNRLAIEMKGSGWNSAMVGKLKALLVKHGLFTSRVNVHSFSESALLKAKAAGFPDLGRVVNSTERIPTAAEVKQYGRNVFISYKRVTPALVNSYYSAGIRVWVWTMDTYAEYDKAAALPDGRVYAWFVDDLLEVQRYFETQT
jgi:glycerophosphoryl diester phosphodiesterase